MPRKVRLTLRKFRGTFFGVKRPWRKYTFGEMANCLQGEKKEGLRNQKPFNA